MNRTKSLGFRRDAKAAAKAVLFSLALPFLSLYTPSAFAMKSGPNPARDETAAPLVDNAPNKFSKTPKPGCVVNGRDLECVFSGDNECVFSDGKMKKVPLSLSEGESVEASGCAGDKVFIRTNRHVFAMTSEGESWYGPIFDISAARDAGIAAWAITPHTVYIVTKNGKDAKKGTYGTVFPMYVDDIEKNEKTITYGVPFPLEGIRIVEFGGSVFVASDEKIIAYMFDEKMDWTYLPMATHRGAEFEIKDKRLFYGEKGGEIKEIEVAGSTITIKSAGGPAVDR
jgi:hypothetical protein